MSTADFAIGLTSRLHSKKGGNFPFTFLKPANKMCYETFQKMLTDTKIHSNCERKKMKLLKQETSRKYTQKILTQLY